ncbi:hypothetical protein [Nocardia sp. NPDC050406]|uniref:hypothetical protein n=1 Tax=Nocardia sp. NPDC050406 TaxID=3364318 RepID=UPI0037B09F25
MSPMTKTRSHTDNLALIDNVNGTGLTLLLFGVLGSTWTLNATGVEDRGWMLAGMIITALALLTGLVGVARERHRSRTRKNS